MWLTELIGHSKNISRRATWGLTCAIIGNITAWCREGETIGFHRDILMFSFIPLMKCEYAYYIKTEIMLTIHWSYFTDSNLSLPVACLLWQRTSSCTSLSPNIRSFHTSTLLSMLFILRKLFSFSFWIFISFWWTPTHFPTKEPNVTNPWSYH